MISPLEETLRDRKMGSDATITIVGGPSGLARECLDLVSELERLWSRFDQHSELSRLSRGESVLIDPRTRTLIAHMQRGHELTAGSFNPTLLREVIALGYSHSLSGPEPSVIPADLQTHVGILDVHLDESALTLPTGLAIDPGGIGKGAAADAVVELVQERDAAGVLANIGGDIAVWGTPPDGSAWRIGVENPNAPGAMIDTIRIGAGAVATSSQMKRRFASLHGSVSHLVNPATRRPVDTDVATVTVIAGAAWFAEVCTKPGFLWPVSEFLDWLPGVNAAGCVIGLDGTQRVSSNWEGYR